ncbi:MAG TPA: hypothetical protein VF600_00300 [Abditibacteriaceae bacterium]|jgi:hypothetical protein
MDIPENRLRGAASFLNGYAFAQTNGGAGAGGTAGGGGVGPQDLKDTGPSDDDATSPGNIITGGTEGSGIPGEPPPPDRTPGAPPQNAVD